jgi:hypothetical protein
MARTRNATGPLLAAKDSMVHYVRSLLSDLKAQPSR